jgi:hypothetical protein
MIGWLVGFRRLRLTIWEFISDTNRKNPVSEEAGGPRAYSMFDEPPELTPP